MFKPPQESHPTTWLRHSVYTLTRNIQAWSHHPNPVNLFPGEAYAMSMSGGDICTHIGFLSVAVNK